MKRIAFVLALLGILFMPNPLQTIAKSTRDQAILAVPKRTFVATVASVDYTGLRLTIFVDANSAARDVHLASHEMDAIRNGKVATGQKITVLQEGSEFYALSVYPGDQNNVYLPLVGNQVGNLNAPTGWAIVQQGTSLYANWNTVPGATMYEIWQSATGSPADAVIANNGLAQALGGTSYNWVLNPGSDSQIITVNPGFETGDMTGWNIQTYWSISTVTAHTGTHSAYFVQTPVSGTVLGDFYSQKYSVVASSSYAVSYAIRINTIAAGGTAVVLLLTWRDSSGALIQNDTPAALTQSATTSWTVLSTTISSPVGAATLEVSLHTAVVSPGTLTAYADDVSVIGKSGVTSATSYYAVRAIDINSRSSPFSAWLQPVQQSAALGATTGNHLQLDPTGAMIQSSNFVSSATGVKISSGGVEGAVIVSSTEPTAPFPGMVWIDTT